MEDESFLAIRFCLKNVSRSDSCTRLAFTGRSSFVFSLHFSSWPIKIHVLGAVSRKLAWILGTEPHWMWTMVWVVMEEQFILRHNKWVRVFCNQYKFITKIMMNQSDWNRCLFLRKFLLYVLGEKYFTIFLRFILFISVCFYVWVCSLKSRCMERPEEGVGTAWTEATSGTTQYGCRVPNYLS